ncbi:MAG: NAD(P)H-dependent oxidoreductase subunit E [Deltaproteobacteria bacterium]|nr:NAD(P)H-dependent oxidoreductase subunit E [Deltaproteobacteria bacterium]
MPGHACHDLAPASEILGRHPADEAALIQVLQDVQRAYNYLPCDVLARVAETLGVPLARVFSVATFYKAFALKPQGRTIVKVCVGTACHIRGAAMLVEEIERVAGVKPGETTADMALTLRTVNCVGACAMAPVVIVGGEYHGGAKTAGIRKMLGESGTDTDTKGGEG